jgi:hypothetical protein
VSADHIAQVIPLLPQRLFRTPREVVEVSAVVGGTVCLTVRDGEGDPVDVYFSLDQARAHLGVWEEAIEAAEHQLRVAAEPTKPTEADRA